MESLHTERTVQRKAHHGDRVRLTATTRVTLLLYLVKREITRRKRMANRTRPCDCEKSSTPPTILRTMQ